MENNFGKVGVIGIRREDKSKWERRVALTPSHVKQLLEKNPKLKFIVQPSRNRVFRDNEYQKVGAILSEDLSECSFIVGVKEVPKEKLLPNRSYMFFSHTIKAQDYNMPLLDEVFAQKVRLIDYEKITDDTGKRLVAFGTFAGNAGAIDFLHGIGKYFINLGFSTPFLNVSFTYSYPSLEKAKIALREIGEAIADEGIPEEFCPLVFGITGRGRCSEGVHEILECFPIKVVDPNELQELVKNPKDPKHRSQVYVTYFESEHMVAPKDHEKKFDKKHYYENPHLYDPIFHEKYLPYVSVLYHCMYWDKKFPRLISNEQIKAAAEQKNLRMFGICDVTCDFEGSIQFLTEFTSIDKPFYVYDPITGEKSYETDKPTNNILYQSVDHLPTELAFDASTHFAEKLSPFIENIALSDISKPFEEQGLCPEIKRAVITWNGALTPSFRYIAELRAANESIKKLKGFETKEPTMKKAQSFTTLKFKGHLFDTKGINEIFDILEKYQLHFRVLEINIGQSPAEMTTAFIQVFSKDLEKYGQAVDAIYDVGDKHKLDISE
jgi:alpha-aminoadipic semialdehyde synthase